MSSDLKQLKALINQCMLFDRFRFNKKLKALSSNVDIKKHDQFLQLEQQITRSILMAESRHNCKPVPRFPLNLPVNERQDDICKAIEEISGKTPKTTQKIAELKRAAAAKAQADDD